MFKRLRNNFLILNMSIISIVMLIAFGTIYFSFYLNVQRVNREILDDIAHNRQIPFRTIDDIIRVDYYREFFGVVPTDYAISFSLILNEEGRIVRIISLLDKPDEDYHVLANKAFTSNVNYNTIKYQGHEWMYRIDSLGSLSPIGDASEAIAGNFTSITFLEVSSTSRALNILLFNFTIASALMLAVIFIISWYFAEKAVEPIADAWQRQKQFIADASHELKTPLTIINANVDALKANKKDKIFKQEKWLNYIQNESERMNRLVSDLLYLTRSENLDTIPEELPFNISEAAKEVILSVEAIIYEKKLKLKKKIEKNLIWHGDQNKLKQVMLILIENSIKYTNPKGKIKIDLKKNFRYLEFSVENTGKGIPKEDLTKVFDRFYRSDQARTGSDNSYGLGLAIAKATIEKMHGKISVQSIPNESTKFTIRLRTKPDLNFMKTKNIKKT